MWSLGVGAETPPRSHPLGLLASHALLLPLAGPWPELGSRRFLRLLGDRPRAESPRCPPQSDCAPPCTLGWGGECGSQPPSFHPESPKNQTCSGVPHPSPESCKGVAGPACSGLGGYPHLCPPHTSPLSIKAWFRWQKAISVITYHITTAISNLPCTFPSMMP